MAGNAVAGMGTRVAQTGALASQDVLVSSDGGYDDSPCRSNIRCPIVHSDTERPMVCTLQLFMS